MARASKAQAALESLLRGTNKPISFLLTYLLPEKFISAVHFEVCAPMPLEEMHLPRTNERLAASSGGLFLFHGREDDHFTVVNPVLKSKKLLPKPALQGITPHIDMAHYGDGYQIVVARHVDENDNQGAKTCVMVYDSKVEAWKHHVSKQPQVRNVWNVSPASTLMFHNMFYCIMDASTKKVGTFDIERMLWKPEVFPSQHEILSLSTYNNRIVATSVTSRGDNRQVLRLNFIDLETGKMEFIDEILMPEHGVVAEIKGCENMFMIVVLVSTLPGGAYANMKEANVVFMFCDIKTRKIKWPYQENNKVIELPLRTVLEDRCHFVMLKYEPNYVSKP